MSSKARACSANVQFSHSALRFCCSESCTVSQRVVPCFSRCSFEDDAQRAYHGGTRPWRFDCRNRYLSLAARTEPNRTSSSVSARREGVETSRFHTYSVVAPPDIPAWTRKSVFETQLCARYKLARVEVSIIVPASALPLISLRLSWPPGRRSGHSYLHCCRL